jgi:hypothetical protein
VLVDAAMHSKINTVFGKSITYNVDTLSFDVLLVLPDQGYIPDLIRNASSSQTYMYPFFPDLFTFVSQCKHRR